MFKNKNRRLQVLGAGVAALVALTLSGCGSSGSSGGSNQPLQIAFLAASSQNGYNQAVGQGIRQEVKKLGIKANVKILDGQFNADTQLSQLQNATSSGQYDGVIVVPQDGPGLAAAFPTSANIPVVSVLNPIGSDINKMQPQVDGVISTVAVSPSSAAKKQADAVAAYCQKINPCKVALLVGDLTSPLDVARRDAYNSVLKKHSNIKVVATLQGKYDRDQSLTAVGNMLQRVPNVNVILSNADQQTEGAQVALQNAGIAPKSVYLTGGGGTQEAIKALREGSWHADYVNFPVSMGAAAMQQLYNNLNNKPVKSWVNADEVGAIPPYQTSASISKYPNFHGEWNG